MLISMIREGRNNYYIDLERRNSSYYYHAIYANNKSISYMSNEEIKDLLKRIFTSNLEFLRKEGEYDVYLDEANNRRYFKDKKENLLLFLQKNGTPAIYYSSENNNMLTKMKNYCLKGKGKKIFVTTSSILFYLSVGISVVNIGYQLNNNYLHKIVLSQESTKISFEEIKKNIINSTDSTITTMQKNYLVNMNFINDVIETADISRNYILRKKTEDLSISYFYDEENMYGYYSLKDINTIHLKDESNKIFHNALAHEFVHLLQDQNQYNYILEASAEIMAKEYYHEKDHAYSEARKRLCILMEMIGPNPIMECNFSGDTSTFEEAINKNLEEKDAEELLILFTKSPYYDEDQESTNKKIDTLLAKMYKNITGNDIEKDILINHIYSNDSLDRVYFNQNTSKFYETISIGELSSVTKYDYEKIKESGMITKYICHKNKTISESEYENFISTENNYVYAVYHPTEGYYIDPTSHDVIKSDGKAIYPLEEAFTKGLIEEIEYVKYEEDQYNSLEDLINENNINNEYMNTDIQVLFINGEKGNLRRDKKSTYIIKTNYHAREKSIAEKFPDQVRKNNLPTYSEINQSDLESMLLECKNMPKESENSIKK